MTKIQVTSGSVRKILKSYQPKTALAEYVWNGFDAGATEVAIEYECDALGNLLYLNVSDNGSGIDYDRLHHTFFPFYESEKAARKGNPQSSSVLHGRNGRGRLTFFAFAHWAEWQSTCRKADDLSSCTIKISVNGLHHYNASRSEQVLHSQPETIVHFHDVLIGREEMEQVVEPYLGMEFCWFLALNRERKVKLTINGRPLAYAHYMAQEEHFSLHDEESGSDFDIHFIQWKSLLGRELSKFYFMDGEGNEVYKKYTAHNKKADEFSHSIYIRSRFFNDFDFREQEDTAQPTIFKNTAQAPVYRYLLRELDEFIKQKKQPYLQQQARKLLAQFREEGVFPGTSSAPGNTGRQPALEEALTRLYEARPRLFTGLNGEQKKAMVRMVDIVLQQYSATEAFHLINSVMQAEADTED